MEIKKIAVIGAGAMGSGIAQVALTSGYQVVLNDTKQEIVEKAKASIEKRFASSVAKGKMTEEEKTAYLADLTVSEDIAAAADCDLVIEAIYENLEAKQAIYQKLEAVCREDVILASNTSSISLTLLASKLKRPENFVGMHFFNPVPVMKLLEIIRGLNTSDEALAVAQEVGAKMKKVTIISKDMPGFIVNRLLDPMLNEAIRILDEGIGTVEDIDNGMKYGLNHPMGPFELMDMAGIDVLLAVMEVMVHELGNQQYSPAPLLRKMVTAGFHGKKTGKGFYVYDEKGQKLGVNPIFQ